MDDNKHKKIMQKQKTNIDKRIADANIDKGLVLLLTGNGKAKTTSAFGMAMRCLGHNLPIAIVQFIKGTQLSGEELYIKNQHPEVAFYQMGTGFTWDTQDRTADITAAKKTWEFAEKYLKDANTYLVILDELTYMLAFKYLDEDQIIQCISNRPKHQSVVITGRGGGEKLRAIADTHSDIKSVKHAYDANIQARKGIDY